MNKTKFKEVIFKISIAMLLYFIVSNVLGLGGILLKSQFIDSKNIHSIINIIVWILSILPSYLYLQPSVERKDREVNKLNNKQTANWILMGLFIVTAIQYVLATITKQASNFDVAELLGVDFNSIIQVILFILNISILPAIFEELLFRGAMLKILKKYGNLIAIIATSVCFGLIHQNITQGIFAFFMGVVLSYITIKTKSIIPAMFIHFLNNFVAVALTIAQKTNNTLLINTTVIVVFAVAIISFICLLINIIKNRKIFKLDGTEIIIKNAWSSIFSQYIVMITLFLYIVIAIYMEMVLF